MSSKNEPTKKEILDLAHKIVIITNHALEQKHCDDENKFCQTVEKLHIIGEKMIKNVLKE